MDNKIYTYVKNLINAEPRQYGYTDESWNGAERARMRKIAKQMGLVEIDNPFIPGEKIYYRA